MGHKCVGVAEEMVDDLHGYRIDYCVDAVLSMERGHKTTTGSNFDPSNYNGTFSFSLYEPTLKPTHTLHYRSIALQGLWNKKEGGVIIKLDVSNSVCVYIWMRSAESSWLLQEKRPHHSLI